MKAYAFLIEMGFEKIPVVVLRQILQPTEDLEEILKPTWDHASRGLRFKLYKDKEKSSGQRPEQNILQIYKVHNEIYTNLCDTRVKKYYADEVTKTKALLVEVQSEVHDFNKNILEKVYLHAIIKEEGPPDQINFIEKPMFNIKGEHI